MSSFFYWIEDIFVNYLFAPLDLLRFTDNWWVSNVINWIFFVICFVAFVYWMKQLKIFNDREEEDKSITSHTYL